MKMNPYLCMTFVITSTVFILIAAHTPISTHPSYFEAIWTIKISIIYSDLFMKLYLVQSDWELA